MEATLIRTRSLAARSADAALLHALQSARVRGRVHSVFDRAINIADEACGLFTLACLGLDDAPATLVVDVASWEDVGLAAGDEVAAQDGMLRLGPQLEVRLAGCAPWARQLPMFPAHREGLAARLQDARSLLERHAQGGGERAQHHRDRLVAPGVRRRARADRADRHEQRRHRRHRRHGQSRFSRATP